jgi:hypothetical protein
MNISVSRGGVEIGEWPEAEVLALYRGGHLVATDFYWMPGMAEWVELSTLVSTPPVPAIPAVTSVPVAAPTAPPKPRTGIARFVVLYLIASVIFSTIIAAPNVNPGAVIGIWAGNGIIAGFIWVIFKLTTKPKQPESFIAFACISGGIFLLMLLGKL